MNNNWSPTNILLAILISVVCIATCGSYPEIAHAPTPDIPFSIEIECAPVSGEQALARRTIEQLQGDVAVLESQLSVIEWKYFELKALTD